MRRARVELTDAALRALRPPERGAVKVADRLEPGLVIRARAGRSALEWLFRYSVGGRRRETLLGQYRPGGLSLAAARERARGLRERIRAGADPAAEAEAARAARREAERVRREALATERARAAGEPIPGSFAAMAGAFQRSPEHEALSGSSRTGIRAALGHALPRWGERDARELRPADARALLRAVAGREGGVGGPAAAAAARAWLARIFAWAVENDWPDADAPVQVVPFARVRVTGGSEARQRALSPAELAAFWCAAATGPLPYAAFARLLLLLGLRRSELTGARWSDLRRDSFGLWLRVPPERTKARREHLAPLAAAAEAELARLATMREAGSDWLFPGSAPGGRLGDSTVGSYRARLAARIAETAPPPEGAGGWVWHDCRRTCRTLLAALGVPAEVAEAYIGHARRGLEAVYNVHDFARERQEAAAKLGAHLCELGGEGMAPAAVLPFLPGGR